MMARRDNRHPRIRLAGVATRGDTILLVKHRREGREYYLLPGGGLEWGETCAEGLAREFLEELSLKIKVGDLVAVNESLDPQGRRHILNLTFRVRLLGGAMTVHQDQRLKEARWVGQDEFKRLTFYPDIRQHLLAAWKKGFPPGARLLRTPWD